MWLEGWRNESVIRLMGWTGTVVSDISDVIWHWLPPHKPFLHCLSPSLSLTLSSHSASHQCSLQLHIGSCKLTNLSVCLSQLLSALCGGEWDTNERKRKRLYLLSHNRTRNYKAWYDTTLFVSFGDWWDEKSKITFIISLVSIHVALIERVSCPCRYPENIPGHRKRFKPSCSILSPPLKLLPWSKTNSSQCHQEGVCVDGSTVIQINSNVI